MVESRLLYHKGITWPVSVRGNICHSVTSFHREKKKESSGNELTSLFERKIIFQRSDTSNIVILIVDFTISNGLYHADSFNSQIYAQLY